METIKDAQGREYKKVGETYFHPETDDDLCRIIDALIAARRETRVRIFQGDRVTGKDWGEENDVTGYMGRSTGTIAIPLLIKNQRSFGGPALLDNCILKLQTTSGNVLWQADNYIPLVWWSGLLDKPERTADGKAYIAGVWRRDLHAGEDTKLLHSRHETLESAARLSDFMAGRRGNK